MTNPHIAIGIQCALPVGRSHWLVPARCPVDIEPIEHDPAVKCQHCEDTRQYLDKDCFLAPLSAAGSSDKSGGTVAVVCRSDRGGQASTRGVDRVAKPESTGTLRDLRLDHACTHGDRGKQNEMSWLQVKSLMNNSSSQRSRLW